MELDQLWEWDSRKLACRIRQENGNPAGDALKETYDGLRDALKKSNVDLDDILNEMKQKKKREANKLTTDVDAEKSFKGVLGKTRIIGATKLALMEMEEYDKAKSKTVTQKNIKKLYTVLPKSPPRRVLLEIQREVSKPLLHLPDQVESATEKLGKKLAKQRAQRAKQNEKKYDFGDDILLDTAINSKVWVEKVQDLLPTYEGDKFGTGGSYMEGMVYLSRMAGSSDLTTNPSAGEGERKLSDEDLAEEERIRAAAAVTGANDGALDDDSRPDINAKLSCAISLCNWARNPVNAQRLASEGAVTAINQLCGENVSRITRYCAAAFRFMSEHAPTAIAMIEEQAIATISDLINTNQDEFILFNLSIALVNITRLNGREGQIVENFKIYTPLLSLISLKPNELGPTCVRGLYNLTCIDVQYPSIERVIQKLVQLVSISAAGNVTAKVKHLCAAALCNLSDLRPVRTRMVEEGTIGALSILSKGAETRTRRICAVILQNLSATTPTGRVEMASRSAVSVAYGLSSDQDPVILRCIGLCLSRLALEPTNCQRIIHESGIAALSNIAVKYPTIPGITQPVAAAFQLLSTSKPYRISMVNEGSITAIASLLRSSIDMFTLQRSLLALCNLLCETDNHLPIIQLGLINTLVTMCGNENELLKDCCSLAFLNLSVSEDSKKHIVNAGAVSAIISTSQQNSVVTKNRCAATLCNLSSFGAGISKMVADGIIPCIVELLLATDISTVHYACAALCRLCSTVENARLILDSGAVPSLVRGAMEGDQDTKQFCGAVLSSLSVYDYCRIPLSEHGAIAALKGLASLNDEVTKQRCLVAFANLSCEVSIQMKMVNEGVVSIISQLIANSYTEINYICCAKAICNLACCESAKLTVAKEGGVNSLMMICMVQSVDSITKLLCVLGLNNLLDATTVEFMVSEGLIGSIANLSKLKGDQHMLQLVHICTKILNHLTKYQVARLKIAEKAVYMTAIYNLTEASLVDTQTVAIRTCCNMTLDEKTREAAVDAGVLRAIEKGLLSEDVGTMTQCLNALFSLCCESSFLNIISKTSLPVTLVDLMNKKPFLAKEISVSSKIIALIAFDKSARKNLQTTAYIGSILQLIKQASHPTIIEGLIISLRFFVLDYPNTTELIPLGIIDAIISVHERLAGNANASLCQEAYKSIVDILRSLIDTLQNISLVLHPMLPVVLNTAVSYISDSHNAQVDAGDKKAVEWFLYHAAVIVYRFSCFDPATRLGISTPETSALIITLSRFDITFELLVYTLGMFLSDVKARTPFMNADIFKVVSSLAASSISENSISNLVLAIYALSKVAACRELVMSPAIALDKALLNFISMENPRIKANSTRAFKNLNSDVNEAIEEGAVANLIAMSLEGKIKNQASDEYLEIAVIPHSDHKLVVPSFSRDVLRGETALLSCRWFARVTVTKGGAAGKGPGPPEPPVMAPDNSLQGSNLMDELESGESEQRTKMAFAKMPVPPTVKDSFLLLDADFITRTEEEQPPSKENNDESKATADDSAASATEVVNRESELSLPKIGSSPQGSSPGQRSKHNHNSRSPTSSGQLGDSDDNSVASGEEKRQGTNNGPRKSRGSKKGAALEATKESIKAQINSEGRKPHSSSGSRPNNTHSSGPAPAEKAAQLGLF